MKMTMTLMQRPLLIAVAATFAAACSTMQPAAYDKPAEQASWVGPAGPAGATGPAGAQGATGSQGATGYTGVQGRTELAGISGETGARGAAGPQGAMGATGVQGPMAAGGTWSLYRDYTFNANSDDILRPDADKAREVADYSRQNPSYHVGLDGSSKRRVNSVREALIAAGVPADKIQA